MVMTFDDGMLGIYSTINIAPKGDKPVLNLKLKAKYFFCFDNLGITRYYTALQANQQIETVVNVPDWIDVSATDICVLENNKQYRIRLIQPEKDDNNLRITKLTLERLGENYAISS